MASSMPSDRYPMPSMSSQYGVVFPFLTPQFDYFCSWHKGVHRGGTRCERAPHYMCYSCRIWHRMAYVCRVEEHRIDNEPDGPAIRDAMTRHRNHILGCADMHEQVIEYLLKKGYTKTEAQLRAESSAEAAGDRSLAKQDSETLKTYATGYRSLKSWVEGALDIYKPELRRILWPVFLYIYLSLVGQHYGDGAKRFFDSHADDFRPEHDDELRQFAAITAPNHLEESELAKKFRQNQYRVTLSRMGYELMLQHLEETLNKGGKQITSILQQNMTIVTVDRAVDDRYSLRHLLKKNKDQDDFPAEDEGIPGHNPGSANEQQAPGATTLQKVFLGPLPLEPELLDDVMAELAEQDTKYPAANGEPLLTDHFDHMVKVESSDPSSIPPNPEQHPPLPASRVRDVMIEVQKVRDNRARFKIGGRTGGMAPGVSVCMYTFHNTNDSVTCVDFSDDNKYIAAGMSEHHIRVWNMDGSPFKSDVDGGQPQQTRRLIGHSQPVYSVAFSPSAELNHPSSDDDSARPDTGSQYLLSSSGDKTVRLWDLKQFACVAIYEGHRGPVWDVKWGPFGYYFVSGGRDGTARLWATEHTTDLRLFVGHDQDVNYVAFHPNNAYVFTAGYDKTVRMWQVTTGTPVRMFTGHAADLSAIACAPNGKLVASADDNGVIIVWDIAPGKLLKRLRGHDKGGVHSLSFSAESTVLISGGQDGTVRVWDIQGTTDVNQQGNVVGEGGAGQKLDGSAQASATGTKKKGKEAVVSPEQISAFPTKKSPVYKAKFTRMNLAMAAGAYLP